MGRLIYLAMTRPDLAYVIHVLSQFMHDPKTDHLDVAAWVVRYLKANPGQGIFLCADSDLRLVTWCDADCVACHLSRRSLSGWFIHLGCSPISWKTRKQCVVSRSSKEAEYQVIADTVSEILWLRELLTILGVDCSPTIPLHCYNLSAIHLSANPVFHERTKHVAFDYHFIRDEIVRGVISIKHVSITMHFADIFTKALGQKEFEGFVRKLGICDLHTPT